MKKYFYFLFTCCLFSAFQNCTPLKITTEKNKEQATTTSPADEAIAELAADTCETIRLLSPQHNQKFDGGNEKVRPVFSWESNLDVEAQYVFELYQNNQGRRKLVFETKTRETRLYWPEQVAWLNERKNVERNYEWRVRSVKNSKNKARNCKDIFKGYFIATTNQLEVYSTLQNSECKGYDANGNVCYTITEEWTILNDRYPVVYLVTNNPYAVEDDNNNPVSISNFTSVPTGFPPLTLNQNSVAYVYNISYEVCVPVGTSYITTDLGYRDTPTPTPFSNVSYTATQIPLEPCVCDFCERVQSRMSATVIGSWQLHSSTDPMYDELFLGVRLVYPGSVLRINAEIIDYEHYHPEDPLCSGLCNKKAASYGTFTDGPLLIEYNPSYSAFVNRLIPVGGWKNNGFAYGYTNNDGSFVSRELIWESNSAAGVNATNSIINLLSIGLPEYHSCCQDAFEICIRYSFTDVKCKVCDIVVCYQFDRTDRTIRVVPQRNNNLDASKKETTENERSKKWFQKSQNTITIEDAKAIFKKQ